MSRTRETAAELDSAIDSLLSRPARPVDTEEGELVATARLLRDALPRLHPRFGFEEHLAARLAAARRLTEGPTGQVEPAEPVPLRPFLNAAEPATDGRLTQPLTAAAEHRRLGLVAGGAIASGVSLAGAALVVWRRTRSSGGLL